MSVMISKAQILANIIDDALDAIPDTVDNRSVRAKLRQAVRLVDELEREVERLRREREMRQPPPSAN